MATSYNAYKLNLARTQYTVRMAVGKNDELFIVYKYLDKYYFAVWSKLIETWLVQKYLISSSSTIPPFVIADKQGDLGGYILYYGADNNDSRDISYSNVSEKGGITLTRFSRTGTIIWQKVYKRQFLGHPEVSPHYQTNVDFHYIGLQPITWSRDFSKIYIASIFYSNLPGGDTDNIHRHLLAIDPESGDLLYDIGFDPLLSGNFTHLDGYYLSHVEASPYSNEVIITGLAKTNSNHLWWCRFEDDDSTFSVVPNGAGIFNPPPGYESKNWHCLKPAYLPDGDVLFSTAPLNDQSIEYPEAFLFRKNLDNISANRWGFSHFANRGDNIIDDPLDQSEYLRVSARPDMFILNEAADKLVVASANKNKRFPIYTDDGEFDFDNWEVDYSHATMVQTIFSFNPDVETDSPYEGTENQRVSSQMEMVLGFGTSGNTLCRSVFNLSQNMGFLANGDPVYLLPHGYQDRLVPNIVIGGSWTRVNEDKAEYIDITDDRIKFIRIDYTHTSSGEGHNKVHHGYMGYSDIQAPYVFKRLDIGNQNIIFTTEQSYDIYTSGSYYNQVNAGIMIKVPYDIKPDPNFISIETDGKNAWIVYYVIDGYRIEDVARKNEHFDRIKIEREVNPDSPFEDTFIVSGLKIQFGEANWKTILTTGPTNFGNDLEFCVFAEPRDNARWPIGQDAYVENINLYFYIPVEYDGIWYVTENVKNYLFHEYDNWTGSVITPSILNQDKWIVGNLNNSDWRGDVSVEETLLGLFYQPLYHSDEGFTICILTPECPGLIFEIINIFIPDTHVGETSFGNLVLRNDNNHNLQIADIEVTTGNDVFEFAGFDDWDQSWPVNASIGLPIKFTPTDVTTYTGELTIINKCNKNQIFVVPFEGTGIYGIDTDLVKGDSTLLGIGDIPELYVPESLLNDTASEIIIDQNNKAGVVRKKPIRTVRMK